MVRERIDSRAQTPIGRDLLIESILQRTADARSAVAFVHGIPGIGKSRVLAAAAERARARGDRVIELDAATIEPTDNGFFDALARERGGPIGSIDEAMISLLGNATPVLLTLDGYDVLRLLDSWMRTAFVPALPDNVSMLIGSRDAPASAWMGFPDWGGSFDAIALGPLDDANAVELLVAAGVPPASVPEINRLAQGHPLALTLAAEAFKTHPEIGIRDAAIQGVVDGLAGSLLAEEADPLVERALKAAAVTRRTTESLLQVQLPDTDANEAIRRLEALSFVERRWDGLVLHEAVRQAIATHLNMTDPATHRELRRAAWRALQSELRGVGESELWRYTADILYLLESTVLRDGFFPREADTLAVEPAHADDLGTIRTISRAQEHPDETAITEAWLEFQPQSFSVVRDRAAEIVGYRCWAISNQLDPRVLRADPLVAAWVEDIEHSEYADLPAFLLRRWLARDEGEAPGGVQGICWIDCKSSYMKLRPNLGHVYIALHDMETYGEVLGELGFDPLHSVTMDFDGDLLRSAVMRFGPGSVDGWLARLVAKELGIDPQNLLDESSRELVIEGQRTPLTPLEFAVVSYLSSRRGAAVSHVDLIENV